ncbi:MAG: hypothetical protein KME55_40390 [Nostoc indistinguendum CM1-VF10]|jgi:hypothetical protein|nr:hypothetical protein [Nostoc indistinguendum CM1-VF10]
MYSETNFSSKIGSHALVIGGSIAGLLAARILTNHFEQVTIVERDRFPTEPAPRKGAPQTYHTHTLLNRGRLILEQLFPGLQAELVAAGAPLVDIAADAAWLNPAGWSVRFPSGLHTLTCSRKLLEWSIRQRLAAFSQVRFLEECEVTGLLPSTDRTSVVGAEVHLRSKLDRRTASIAKLSTELVVDASGRASKVPQWFTAMGYTPPRETVVNAHIGYASRIYLPPPEFQADWQGLYLQMAPPTNTRLGIVLPVEGGQWYVSLAGGNRDYPPTDEKGFLEFARNLRSSEVYDAIKDAKPLSPIYSYRVGC